MEIFVPIRVIRGSYKFRTAREDESEDAAELVPSAKAPWRRAGPPHPGFTRFEPALFLRFAALEPTAGAFGGFATEWGPLLAPFRHLPGDIAATGTAHSLEPETLGRWREEHGLMRAALTMWMPSHPLPGRPIEMEDVEHRCATRITQAAFITFDPAESPAWEGFPGLALVPVNLCGMMWLQFAQSVARPEQGQFVACQHCGKWFAVTRTNMSRSSKVYCSSNCRAYASKERRIVMEALRPPVGAVTGLAPHEAGIGYRDRQLGPGPNDG